MDSCCLVHYALWYAEHYCQCMCVCVCVCVVCVWMLAAVSNFGLQQHYNCQLSWWYKGDQFTHSLTLTLTTHTSYDIKQRPPMFYIAMCVQHVLRLTDRINLACDILLATEEVLTQLEWFCLVRMRRKRVKSGRIGITGLVTATLIPSGIHTIVSTYNGCPSVIPMVRRLICSFSVLWKAPSATAPATCRFSIHPPLPNAITGQPRNNALPLKNKIKVVPRRG